MRRYPIVTALIAAALVAACQGPTGTPVGGGSPAPAMQAVSGSFSVKGVLSADGLSVQQVGGSGVAGASVYLDDLPSLRATTGADGGFTISGVPAGEHFVVGEKGTLKVRARVSLAPETPVADLQSLLLRRTGSVTGLVKLDAGAGALGADVFVAGTTMIAKAKDNGAYGLANVAEGTYKVTATYPGYAPATLEVAVKAGQASTLDIPLTKLDPSVAVSTLKGLVTDAAGKPLPGANVSARGASSFSTLADDQGRFVLGNLPDGAYDLLIFSPGAALSARSVTLAAATGKERDLGAIALATASAAVAPVASASTVPAAPASVAPVASSAPATAAPDANPYGVIDSQLLKPGGATRSTNAGKTAIGNDVYDVALGQAFKPTRDGRLATFAMMIGAASADVTVSIYQADSGGFPDTTKRVGAGTLPASEVQGFSDFTYFRFAAPLAVSAGKTYVAVVTAPGGEASLALTDKAGDAGKLALSFAASGGEYLSWDTTPANGGFEYIAYRAYMAP